MDALSESLKPLSQMGPRDMRALAQKHLTKASMVEYNEAAKAAAHEAGVVWKRLLGKRNPAWSRRGGGISFQEQKTIDDAAKHVHTTALALAFSRLLNRQRQERS